MVNVLLFRRGWDDRDLWLLSNRATVGAGDVIFFVIVIGRHPTVARADVLASSGRWLLGLCCCLLAHIIRISTEKANFFQQLKPRAESSS